MLFNCDRMWSRLMALSYRVRRKPIVTNAAPRRNDEAAA